MLKINKGQERCEGKVVVALTVREEQGVRRDEKFPSKEDLEVYRRLGEGIGLEGSLHGSLDAGIEELEGQT